MEPEKLLLFIGVVLIVLIIIQIIFKLFALFKINLVDKDIFWKEKVGDKDFIKEMKKVKLTRELESAQYSTFVQTSNEKAWSSSLSVSNQIIEKIKKVDTEDIDIYKNLEFTYACVWDCNLPKFETVAICFNCIKYSKNTDHRNKAEIRKE